MKIRLRDHVTIQADKMAKVLLASTPRALVDLYCLAPGQAQKPHAHADQDKLYVVLEGHGRIHLDGIGGGGGARGGRGGEGGSRPRRRQ